VRLLLSAFGVLVLVLTGAPPAGAEITEGCTAVAVFPDGTVVDPAQGDVFTIPRSGSGVEWSGSLGDGAAETEPRIHSGRLEVKLPPLADSIVGLFVDDSETEVRVWGDADATTTAEMGVDGYSLPDWLPAGAEVRVEGVHFDDVQSCEGWVILKLDGSPWSSPTTWIAVGGSVLSLIGLVWALRARPGTYDPVRGNPIVGVIAGGFLGAFLAPLLWALGLIPLHSPAWLVLPVIGAIAGLVGGLYPPFKRPPARGPDTDPEPDDAGPDEQVVAATPSAPTPASDIGPAGTARTLSEMESDAASDPPPPPQ